MPDDKKKIATDDLPPSKDTEETEEKPETQATEESPQEFTVAGKTYKGIDELTKALENANKKLSEQGNQTGTLKRQVDMLQAQLDEAKQAGTPAQETGPNVDDQIKQLQKAVDEGEIDIGEALVTMQDLTAQKVLASAREEMDQRQQEQDAKVIRQKFINDHPDFVELLNSGQLETVKQENPLHDDFSAYWAYQAQRAANEVQTAVERAREEGKSEQASLEEGARTAKGKGVVSKSGAGVRQQHYASKSKPLTEKERFDSGMDALKRAREES